MSYKAQITEFQSSSAPEGGCHRVNQRGTVILIGFNPHPPRKADATLHAGSDG